MRTMNRILSVLFLTGLIFSNCTVAQEQMSEYERVQLIYQSLEYNTLAFNDLKQKWVINDPVLVREIYNRFIVRDALREKGSKVPLAAVKAKTETIYSGSVVIDLRKRYYDDEIEYFAFVPEDQLQAENPVYLADPVKDPFLLQDIIGVKLYDKIKGQGYFYSNLTKSTYDTKSGYFYDVYLNLLEPRIMYWNTTSGGRNKYLLSFFGKWGVDQIALPGWYIGEYVIGSELTYYQSIAGDPSKYLYDFRVGIPIKSGRPFLGDKGQLLIQPTGQSVYARASGDVLKYIMDGAEGYILSLEGKYSVGEFKAKDFEPILYDTICSVRSYGVIEVKKKDLYNLGDFGNLEFGGGVATSDIYRYLLNAKKTSKLTDLDKNKNFLQKFRHNIFIQAGLSRTGGLVQHQTNLQLTFDSEGFASVGIFSKVMLSDQFGFDIRIMQGFGADKTTKRWRPDSYIVFSPILRINY